MFQRGMWILCISYSRNDVGCILLIGFPTSINQQENHFFRDETIYEKDLDGKGDKPKHLTELSCSQYAVVVWVYWRTKQSVAF